MIEAADGRLRVTVPMVMEHARALLEQGSRRLIGGHWVIDLGAVEDADSSAVAVMLGWLRAAAESRSTVHFAQIPAGVRSLAELYGVSDLLPRV